MCCCNYLYKRNNYAHKVNSYTVRASTFSRTELLAYRTVLNHAIPVRQKKIRFTKNYSVCQKNSSVRYDTRKSSVREKVDARIVLSYIFSQEKTSDLGWVGLGHPNPEKSQTQSKNHPNLEPKIPKV
jgi:hypothetical protein